MKTHSQTKYKFVNSIWVTGRFNDQLVLGRTCIHEGRNSISMVNESGAQLLVQFDSIRNIKKLTFANKIIPAVTISFHKKKRVSSIEKMIIKTLNAINK